MTSINYSASASSAVRVLQSANRDLDMTQGRISSGFKVNSAKDNATVWRAATQLRSEIKSYDTVKSSMDYAKGVFEAAAAGADAVADIMGEIRTAVLTGVAAASGSAERTAAQSRLTDLQAQLKAVVADGGVNGSNLLKGDTGPSILTGFTANGSGTTDTVTAVNLIGTTAGLLGEADATKYGTVDGTTGTASVLTMSIAGVAALAAGTARDAVFTSLAAATKTVTDYSAALGSAANRIQSSQDYLGKIADIKKSALSSMVDADMEVESAKLAALQVKQQLATQALSIANSSQQNVLRLFQ